MNDQAPQAAAPQPPQIDLEKYIGKFVELRDRLKAENDALSEKQKPLREAMEKIEGVVMAVLHSTGASNIKTGAGTASILDKWTAVVDDPSVFREFCVTNNQLDLANIAANEKNCREYLTAKGALPPGVRLTNFKKLGVRRATTKSAE